MVRTDLSAPSVAGYAAGQCRPLGTIMGKGGGSFGGAWISNEQLVQYALNDLRNKAAAIGGNFVHYTTPQFGMSGDQNGSNVSSAMISGTAFACSGRPVAEVAAANPKPKVIVNKGADGERTLGTVLMFPSLRMDVWFSTRQLDKAFWRIGPTGSAVLSADCKSMVLADGVLVKMDAQPSQQKGFTTSLSVTDLEGAAKAARVSGRICETDWYFSDNHAAGLKQLVLQIREEITFKMAQRTP